MQHHSAPTRLLHWSASQFVAAYFACISEHDTDGCIYLVQSGTLAKRVMDRGGPDASKLLYSWTQLEQDSTADWSFDVTTRRPSSRMIAQSGEFSIAMDPLADHAALIHLGAEADHWNRYSHSRWIVPAALKPDILHRLHSMNVTASTLFPGVDGVGRSIAELGITLRYTYGLSTKPAERAADAADAAERE